MLESWWVLSIRWESGRWFTWPVILLRHFGPYTHFPDESRSYGIQVIHDGLCDEMIDSHLPALSNALLAVTQRVFAAILRRIERLTILKVCARD
jgi:hypothetical protein